MSTARTGRPRRATAWRRRALAVLTALALTQLAPPLAAHAVNLNGTIDSLTIETYGAEIVVQGWARDFDQPDRVVEVHVHSHTATQSWQLVGKTQANLYRSDVGNHAYWVRGRAPVGPQRVCAYAITPDNSNPEVACRDITVPGYQYPSGPTSMVDSTNSTTMRGVRGGSPTQGPPLNMWVQGTSTSVPVTVNADGTWKATVRHAARRPVTVCVGSHPTYDQYCGNTGYPSMRGLAKKSRKKRVHLRWTVPPYSWPEAYLDAVNWDVQVRETHRRGKRIKGARWRTPATHRDLQMYEFDVTSPTLERAVRTCFRVRAEFPTQGPTMFRTGWSGERCTTRR
ncbi:MAG: hypothetical protein ACI379_12505 [Nocardioides sp.]|uniref:hypothetical protein n=1 Tax=Nocardioides sp. TaxID=35761 RepID=UPI003EFCF11F